MFIGGVVLLGLCGAELDVALCSLAVLSTGRGWLTDEPFSLPSVFSLGALGRPATNWNALSFAFACDVAGTGGLGGAVTFVVSPRVVLFWFLCQLPGLGWRMSAHYVECGGTCLSVQLYVRCRHGFAHRIKSAYGICQQAYLASLVLFEEACGARRHRLSGKWVGSKANR
jgi:hypothetical protein